eukprot:5601985-Amphidinium_carterae.2
MESAPEEVTHEEMVSAVMTGFVDHKLLSIHGLVVNEASKEKEMQKITNGVDSEKLKKAMIKEMDNLRELK